MVDLSKIANKEEFAKLFDYNILGRKEATTAELYSALETMKKYKFACFMTGAAMVPIVAEELKDLDCEIGTVIDFPFGYSDTKTKIQATQNAVKLGATSVDMVFNIGAVSYTHLAQNMGRILAGGMAAEDFVAVCEELGDKAIAYAEEHEKLGHKQTASDYYFNACSLFRIADYGIRGVNEEKFRIYGKLVRCV